MINTTANELFEQYKDRIQACLKLITVKDDSVSVSVDKTIYVHKDMVLTEHHHITPTEHGGSAFYVGNVEMIYFDDLLELWQEAMQESADDPDKAMALIADLSWWVF